MTGKWLTNSWMNNVDYLASMAHALAGFGVIVTTSYLSDSSWKTVLTVHAIGAVLAGVKEFWFDKNYELPKQTDGDDILDFSMYMLGAFLGYIPLLIRTW